MDPAQLPRLDQIEASTRSRLTEARERQGLGDVSALEDSEVVPQAPTGHQSATSVLTVSA
jgi:hypothetical protein